MLDLDVDVDVNVGLDLELEMGGGLDLYFVSCILYLGRDKDVARGFTR